MRVYNRIQIKALAPIWRAFGQAGRNRKLPA
jgi:hypothetical protein